MICISVRNTNYRILKMTVIYIRHSDDEESNPKHRHDHRISSEGKELAKKITEKLIRKFGEPDLIVATPMKRGKDTVKEMGKLIKNKNPQVIFDTNISRYFSRAEQDDPSIFQDTGKTGIPIIESWQDFRKRVATHVRFIKDSNFLNEKYTVYVITHSLVLKEVARIFNIERKIPRRFKFMYYFYIKSEKERDQPIRPE